MQLAAALAAVVAAAAMAAVAAVDDKDGVQCWRREGALTRGDATSWHDDVTRRRHGDSLLDPNGINWQGGDHGHSLY